ncbi:MAG: Transglycosylase domain protein [Mycobacterium sp.]|nr:Transglycosylase domain protein [Mycobacterium sp.]
MSNTTLTTGVPAKRRRRTLAAGFASVAAAAAVTAGTAGTASAAVSGDPFPALRQCESGGNYAANTGNGFYGAYQFTQATWKGLGYSGLPSNAAPATQDAAARTLQARAGWGQWPACSAKLGLRGTGGATSAAVPVATAAAHVGTRAVAATPVSTAPSARPVLSLALADHYVQAVHDWQVLMNAHGATLTVDGGYGPQSAAAARAFELAHGLTVDSGIAGPQVWGALTGDAS